MRHMIRGSIGALFLVVAAASCNTMPPIPPPEAVLAGTWTLTSERDLGFSKKELDFDADGFLTEIRTSKKDFFGNDEVVRERNLQIASKVTGTSVHVEMTSDSASRFLFDGTFNAGITSADGELVSESDSFFSDTVIDTDNGKGTMVKN